MSGLLITVTSAGYRALVNKPNTGTNAVTVTHIGLSAASFTANEDMTALPGEFMRLTSFGGVAVAKDTLHLSIRDDGPSQYAYRAFGLYLSDGTLFAIYSQPDVILDKSAAASMLLTADVRFQKIDATTLVFGDTYWLNPPATETVQGVLEIADRAEAIAGTDHTRALTPAGGKAIMDARLGEGAPSTFIKSLLNTASALLLRGALGLGNAAVRNEGAGNNLDADKLDGEHGAFYRDFRNLNNLPPDFNPSTHKHLWADLSNVPDTAMRWPFWEEVQNRPKTMTPDPHVHSAADITSGVLGLDRIPALPMPRVTGLESVLAGKASTGGGDMTGQWRFMRNNPPPDGSAYNTGNIELRTHDASFPRIGFHRSGADAIALTYEGGATVSLWTNSGSRHLLWHGGNFDPNGKANINGDSVGSMRLIGGGAAYYVRDRDSGRDWAMYAHADRIAFFNGGGDIVSITANGAIIANGGFDDGSSVRLKCDLQPLPYGLADIERIVTRVGRYRDFYNGDGRLRLFVLAEQLRGVIPEAVNDDGIIIDGDSYGTVQYSQLIPPLIVGEQQLAENARRDRAQVAQVRADLDALADEFRSFVSEMRASREAA